MPRSLCPKCDYPVITCLCETLATLPKLTTKVTLHVMQHPTEVTNKKNTIKLAQLVLDKLQLYIGESSDDFVDLRAQVDTSTEPFIVLFPSDKALSWPQFNQQMPELTPERLNLILVDGTWRKAKKILLSNPWLQDLGHLTLAMTEQSQYGIRKTNVEGGLSSIEAIAYGLEQIEGTDPSSLLKLLSAFKNAFTKHMPADVKKRYR